uniref:N-terminal acetyltransferase B complex subunit MDM20 homolog n=1 Tax=Timema genevievae TaxID=629358 RepID=A0A7R9JW01_TIMGE|nr:unnamed protein product [Timema genevievae]
MASKTHVDVSVAERRLRPIYDWLDNGNNKKALQEAEKVLKKQPNFQPARVLKALALLRLGKEEECIQHLEVVQAEVPVDESALQAMTICFKELHKPEKICDIYNAATKKDPSNEELLTHLFMAHVRVGDYKKQQQVAMSLYKLKPKNPYYFWAVMSIVMQAYESDEKLAKSVVLPLAERMVKKFAVEDKIEAEQEVLLYLMVLEMQGKYNEALEVLEGPLGEKLVSYVFVPFKKCNLLIKLKKWHESNLLCKSLLRKDLDAWEYYKDYFTSALELFDSRQGDANGEVDNSPEMCSNFLLSLMEQNEKLPRQLRGPYLARLELFKRLIDRGVEAEVLLGDIVSLLMDYIHKFGDKPCCVPDLRPYMPLLWFDRRKDFVEQVTKLVGLEEGQYCSSPQQLQLHITSLQLFRCISCHEELNLSNKRQLSLSLYQHYRHGIEFNKSLLHTDIASNDPYALLTAHVLCDLWFETRNSQFLVDALVILENALEFSPSNFHIKLLLLRFYFLLGAGGAAYKVYESLDVKHMQLDSLGWLLCTNIFTLGHFTTTANLYDITLKFFTINYKDSVDHMTFSYKYGSFIKIEEFIQFRERLNNSLHYAMVTVEKMLLEVLACRSYSQAAQVLVDMEICPEVDKISWHKLQDNRDLDVIVSWDPPSKQVTPDVVKTTFLDGVDFTKLRNVILRCLGAAINLGLSDDSKIYNHPGNNASAAVNGELKESEAKTHLNIFVKLFEEFQQMYRSFSARSSDKSLQNMISGPLPSRLDSYLASPSCPVILELLLLLKSLATDNEGSGHTLSNIAANVLELVTSNVQSLVGKVKSFTSHDVDELAERRVLLENFVYGIETISVAALLCGAGCNLINTSKTTLVKKGKKKKEIVNNQSNSQPHSVKSEVLNKVIQGVFYAAEELGSALASWEAYQDPTLQLHNLSLIDDASYTIKVAEKLTDSLKSSLKEMRQVVQIKVKYLMDLKV